MTYSWNAISRQKVTSLFSSAPYKWWISGGIALATYLDASWRTHEDIDISILRQDIQHIPLTLQGWDINFAYKGELIPFTFANNLLLENSNNIWCRPSPTDQWQIDITINSGDQNRWIYRRDSTITLPWKNALFKVDSCHYLVPEVQMLFKSKNIRSKDQEDAEFVLPKLNTQQNAWLTKHLPQGHPWRTLLPTSMVLE